MSKIDRKIGSNKNINKDHKKSPQPDAPKIAGVQYGNLKMLSEKHNDEKLSITFLIEGGRLIAYNCG